jgi:predicted RNA binding protein YcfA (HicA-like mRNA interferase family)
MEVKELIKLVEKDGWKQVRMKGSYRQFKHSMKRGTVTIAGKPNVDVPLGTANNILKQAGLKE